MPAARPLNEPVPVLAGKKVLIVDDNEVNRKLVRIQAERWGMKTRETESSKEALEWLRGTEPFDIVTLDYKMPELDGLSLARYIAEVPHRGKVPLLLLTSALVTREEAAKTGAQFHAVLTKPIRMSQLLDSFMGALGFAVPSAKPAEAVAAIGAGGNGTTALRLLIAEDNPVNQKVALYMLQRLGLRADVVDSGRKAVLAVEKDGYDVILMDVQMPDMDGLEATRQICARWPAGKRPWIIAMTAGALAADRERCLEAGMDDYLAKPIRVQDLDEALRRAQRPSLSGSLAEA